MTNKACVLPSQGYCILTENKNLSKRDFTCWPIFGINQWSKYFLVGREGCGKHYRLSIQSPLSFFLINSIAIWVGGDNYVLFTNSNSLGINNTGRKTKGTVKTDPPKMQQGIREPPPPSPSAPLNDFNED